MKTIVVASTNPVKIRSAQEGFQRMFPEEQFSAQGTTVDSGVAHQPMTDTETLSGARNRATNAKRAKPDADFWIGIEGGVDLMGTGMHAFAWVVILSGGTEHGEARSASFLLPDSLAALVRAGMELGEADDQVFGRQNSKQANGAVGLLTANAVDRETLYVMPVILALIPFKQKPIYFPPE